MDRNLVFRLVGLDQWIFELGRVGSRNLDPCLSAVRLSNVHEMVQDMVMVIAVCRPTS